MAFTSRQLTYVKVHDKPKTNPLHCCGEVTHLDKKTKENTTLKAFDYQVIS
ncbi:hypothetical protein [Bacillus xiamenensis]|uniref:hypothetical protein n=1 Tax=Bacillus xiamenensis TaxID=1178537 RepID=UPI002222320A|nr:hypothetical protein [Bacillus xiamenensis]MCW1835339.1 hypothetical protein [Bacillus xiamenensis]